MLQLVAGGAREAKSIFTCFKPQQSQVLTPLLGGQRQADSEHLPSSPSSPTSPKREDAFSPRQKRQLLFLAGKAKMAVSARFQDTTRRSSGSYWRILITTAVLSSFLSFSIDQFTWAMGVARTRFARGASADDLGWLVTFNCIVAVTARLIVRTTVEAEGSGFPEVKAMLFGKVMLPFLSLRVLFVKAIALALGVGAGLPLGKEGPNVHMAACISRKLGPRFYEGRSGRNSVAGTHLLLAACAVGVGSSFSAPIGGMVFSLELVLPQVFDYIGYTGCFLSAVTGSICFAAYRTLTAGADGMLPLMSTTVAPNMGVGVAPLAVMAIDILLGCICGLLGGVWIRSHAKVVGAMKRWRMRSSQARSKRDSLYDNLMKSEVGWKSQSLRHKLNYMASSVRLSVRKGVEWRDIAQVVLVTMANTILAVSLPLLGGKPQPLLLSTLFDKDLMAKEASSMEDLGPTLTLVCCFLMKWTTTIFALSLPSPAGVVAPTMIIGGLLGRVFGALLPGELVDHLLSAPGVPVTDADRDAFMARLAIVGAAAFCAAVCRAFAMAITVFEVLALPNAVLPLCSASLAAIFTANKIALPYFDTNLKGRGLGGISDLTHTKKAMEPAFNVMRRVDLRVDALEVTTKPESMKTLLSLSDEEHFPIVEPIMGHWADEGVTGVLKGSISRPELEMLVRKVAKRPAAEELCILNPAFTRPDDGSQPLVRCQPTTVGPDTKLQDIYLLLKITGEPVVYVTKDNLLLGVVHFKELLGHSL